MGVITFDDGNAVHLICNHKNCTGNWEFLKNYYSYRHAGNEGWRFEKKPGITDKENMTIENTFAYCPECSKEKGE